MWSLDPLTHVAGPSDASAGTMGWKSPVFSSRGDRFAVVSSAGDIHLWTVAGWKELPKIVANALWILFAPNGESILALGPKDQITEWRITTRQRIGSFKGHLFEVTAACISPNGRLLATGSKDTTVRLWDLASRRELAKFMVGEGVINNLAFSRDGKTIAIGSFEGMIQLWNVASGQQVATLPGHTSYVVSLAFSPDESTLASSGLDNTLRLWKAATWEEIARAKLSPR